MKLLELTRSFYPSVGGFEKSMSDKMKIYDALGIEYNIIATDFHDRLSGDARLPSVTYLKQFSPYNITPSLFKHLRVDCDVVNINLIGRFYSDYAIQYFSRRKTKIILTPHSFYHSDRYKLIKHFIQKYIFPRLLKKIDVLVAFTEYEKSIWVSDYKVPAEQIAVIPHYISHERYEANQNVGNEGKYFLYLGRNDRNKLPELLLKTFLRSYSQGNYSLYMTLNSRDFSPEVGTIISHNRNIKLLGYVDDTQKHQLLLNAAAVVVPTRWEAFGYVPFEASQYAKPLLCSNIPVFRELLNSKGVLFFDNSEHSLAEMLHKFMHLSNEQQLSMGKANQLNLLKYTFEASRNKYQQLFEQLNLLRTTA
jgi:glycosyltransferase involved in cell wall biosynthesis